MAYDIYLSRAEIEKFTADDINCFTNKHEKIQKISFNLKDALLEIIRLRKCGINEYTVGLEEDEAKELINKGFKVTKENDNLSDLIDYTVKW